MPTFKRNHLLICSTTTYKSTDPFTKKNIFIAIYQSTQQRCILPRFAVGYLRMYWKNNLQSYQIIFIFKHINSYLDPKLRTFYSFTRSKTFKVNFTPRTAHQLQTISQYVRLSLSAKILIENFTIATNFYLHHSNFELDLFGQSKV